MSREAEEEPFFAPDLNPLIASSRGMYGRTVRYTFKSVCGNEQTDRTKYKYRNDIPTIDTNEKTIYDDCHYHEEE